ncbi:MAG: divergent polysaccharide deacetylase family protein [Candidatus Omnitrophota bacterium]
MKKQNSNNPLVMFLLLVIFAQAIVIFSLLSKPAAKKQVKPVKPRPALEQKFKAKIAIVLDDWGYTLSNLHYLDEINAPITLAVLPNLNYSKTVARQGRGKGCEIILHLPMQPHEKYNLEKNTILTSMDEGAIKRILNSDLDSLVYAKGASNHMGSLGTENPRVMAIILNELKKRNFYFLDSFVSPLSVASDLAAKMHVKCAKRNIFLDNKLDAEYIKGQLEQLKVKADANGYAIGIGHDRKATLEALKDVIPQWKKEGYKFVELSEIVE